MFVCSGLVLKWEWIFLNGNMEVSKGFIKVLVYLEGFLLGIDIFVSCFFIVLLKFEFVSMFVVLCYILFLFINV